MIKREEVYKIGMFNKPHGIKGELQFTFTDDIFDRVEAEYIICLLNGIFVPFYFEEYRFRTDSTALVKLEGIDSAEQARRFTNVEVYFPTKYAEDGENENLSWNYFNGFRVEEVHQGYLGSITNIDDTTLNTLFIVNKDDREILIPAQEEFILGIDHKHKVITVNLPEGLLQMDKAEEV